jgi:proton-dependent oligopeptide transporter, POT family
VSKPISLKQPGVFKLAFFTAMCERFGFYVLSFLIVLYVKSVLNLSDTEAFSLFAVFTALAYLMPAIGGYLADNIMGIRRSMVLGLLLEGIGLTVLAVPNDHLLPWGLGLVILGVCFYKITPTDLLARAYEKNDPRIDGGFTLFYMAINVGSLLASVLSGFVQVRYGWHIAFLMGAAVLYLGVIIYFILVHTAKKVDAKPGYMKLSTKKIFWLIAGTLVALVCCRLLIVHAVIADIFFFFATACLLLYFLYEIFKSPKKEKLKIIACLCLIVIGMAFFVFYYQAYTSMVLFINRSVNRQVLGFTLPTPLFLAFNPIWILLLSPLLAMAYGYLGRKGKDFAVTTKFSCGMLLVSVCFLSLKFSTYFPDAKGQISGWWICLAFFLYTFAELLISALGVAMVTRIAPKKLYGVMMGAWYLIAASLASALSGIFAGLTAVPENVTDPVTVLNIYGNGFFEMGLIGLGITVVVFIVAPFIKKIAQIE